MNKRILKKKGLSKITSQELWNLDGTLAKYILPRLIKFKRINTNSHPVTFNSLNEWHNTIDKMIWSFEKLLNDNWDYSKVEKENQRYLEGMHLFAEHFADLWD
jgi:hypothetical protein